MGYHPKKESESYEKIMFQPTAADSKDGVQFISSSVKDLVETELLITVKLWLLGWTKLLEFDPDSAKE